MCRSGLMKEDSCHMGQPCHCRLWKEVLVWRRIEVGSLGEVGTASMGVFTIFQGHGFSLVQDSNRDSILKAFWTFFMRRHLFQGKGPIRRPILGFN